MARGAELEQQVLAAVSEVIYREGINATGVDRMCEVAGVSKRTLYQRFHSKDELVGRSLAARDASIAELVLSPGEAARLAGASGTEQILAVFRGLAQALESEEFRGCPYLNAAVELVDPDHPAREAITAHKERVRRWFEAAATAGRLRHPEALSRRLMMVLDGFYVESLLRSDEDVLTDTVTIAESVLAAATPSPSTPPASRHVGRRKDR